MYDYCRCSSDPTPAGCAVASIGKSGGGTKERSQLRGRRDGKASTEISPRCTGLTSTASGWGRATRGYPQVTAPRKRGQGRTPPYHHWVKASRTGTKVREPCLRTSVASEQCEFSYMAVKTETPTSDLEDMLKMCMWSPFPRDLLS